METTHSQRWSKAHEAKCTMTSTTLQSIKNKKAEVQFRTLLKEGKFKHQEPSDQELVKILEERVEKARTTFARLKNKGIKLSLFLEIGAERGQRSMLLASEFNADGYMLDISLESLQSADALKSQINLSVIPQPVCADAEALPFPDNSFAFVFTYQTLHHFPNPSPILKEIYRVLTPGGAFFFDEEPVRQLINLRLWRRPTKLRWWEKMLKATTLLHFISEIGKSETEAGIIETAFDLKTWQKALDIFDEADVTLSVFPFGLPQTIKKSKNPNWLIPPKTINFLVDLMGGGIAAICTKKGTLKPKRPVFTCSSCPSHSQLQRKKQYLLCPNCKDIYPIAHNIPILIEKNLRKKLYG